MLQSARLTILFLLLLSSPVIAQKYAFRTDSDEPRDKSGRMYKGEYYHIGIVVENKACKNLELKSDGLDIIKTKTNDYLIRWKKGKKGAGIVEANLYDKNKFLSSISFEFADSILPPIIRICNKKIGCFPLGRIDSLCANRGWPADKESLKIVFFIAELRNKENEIVFSEPTYSHVMSRKFQEAYGRSYPGYKIIFRNIVVVDDENNIMTTRDWSYRL